MFSKIWYKSFSKLIFLVLILFKIILLRNIKFLIVFFFFKNLGFIFRLKFIFVFLLEVFFNIGNIIFLVVFGIIVFLIMIK